ncbi:hypothetical protein Q9R46_16085 [Paenibacillus sp. RRE4]|uniref:Uncharacterized protein n=1 Tax=Paenibacillus silvae TaxID=1325358 RepID=A0ABQ1Z385_9BACL|nr:MULTISPECIES: hypothetical protein [Paenibacillus]MDT0124179.1 hypothetical protein [Paenibacillus sp. RRE4]GGH46307.1 hypothetical protein GCM10008014_08890 [Paenibacillus silvae]
MKNQQTERVFITFKFEKGNIKYPVDAVFGKGDIFKEIIDLKTNGGTLEYNGKVYDMLELKAVEISFE